MNKRVRVQDIANKLGISRNTVSRALNNQPGLSRERRREILNCAAEMGYMRIISTDETSKKNNDAKQIALFTQNFPYGSHFGTIALSHFQNELHKNGYVMNIFALSPESIRKLILPQNFHIEQHAGIICMELFDKNYLNLLSDFNIPMLCVDAAYDADFNRLKSDLLLMENRLSVGRQVETLISKGKKRFAFAGNPHHCLSFYERYESFNQTLALHNIKPSNNVYCTSKNPVFEDPALLHKVVTSEHNWPEVFICANDGTAIDLICEMRKNNISIPKDVWIAGFDNAQESRILDVPLSTINIPSKDMGKLAADMIMSRIDSPDIAYRSLYARCDLIWKESTPGLA